jgi:hypothetical protein
MCGDVRAAPWATDNAAGVRPLYAGLGRKDGLRDTIEETWVSSEELDAQLVQ